ncbi:MAG: hypothetical protein ACP5L1_03320 [Caldivirga sp.]|uniref:hypothetical protein n=1 Tax=Caldivirga sp. TaxID=2080243 RepID=UPI003D12C008
MSIDDAVANLLRLRSALNIVEVINHELDALPKILVRSLVIITSVLGAYSLIIVFLGVTYLSDIQLSSLGIVLFTLLAAFTLYYIVRELEKASRVRSPYSDWDEKVKEGALGILRILSELDWDTVDYRVRRARSLYPILLVIEELILVALLSLIMPWLISLIMWLILGIQGMTPLNIVGGVLVSIAVALASTWGEISNGAKALWSIDSLMWELRWLYHEYRRIQT